MGIIAKQSIRGTIVTYLGIAVGVVTTFFVLTRFLTTEEIGLARVLIDAATLFIGLAQLGTNASIIRFYPYFREKGSEEDHGFFFWALVVPFIGFVLFAIIYWACRVPLGAWFGDKSPLFVEYYLCFQGVFHGRIGHRSLRQLRRSSADQHALFFLAQTDSSATGLDFPA